MATATLTQSAQNDLEHIWAYIASEASVGVADRVYHGLCKSIRKIEQFPHIGPVVHNEAREIRRLPLHPYSIFYISTGNTTTILRILHYRRRNEPLLNDETRQKR